MNPLASLADYELFIYGLPIQFAGIQQSSLVLVRLGASVARLTGDLAFAGGLRLAVWEHLQFGGPGNSIVQYSYEVWRGDEKLYWYDSQPHPGDAVLRSTHPHHKHIPPDIKHHRIPAPQLSFDRPNLPLLIAEIEALTG